MWHLSSLRLIPAGTESDFPFPGLTKWWFIILKEIFPMKLMLSYMISWAFIYTDFANLFFREPGSNIHPHFMGINYDKKNHKFEALVLSSARICNDGIRRSGSIKTCTIYQHSGSIYAIYSSSTHMSSPEISPNIPPVRTDDLKVPSSTICLRRKSI